MNKEQAWKGRMQRVYFGWWVVIVTGVFQALFSGFYHTGISLYFLPLTRAFEVSRTKLSLAFSVRTLEGGVEGPVAGYLVDRFGPRLVVVFGVLMGGIGFILLALVHSYAVFLVVFLGFLAIGFSTPFHGMTAAINYWFRRRLGTAMSLAQSGSAIGGFVITPLIAWIILNHGWRTAAMISGIVLLVVGLPLSFLVRNPRGSEAAAEDAGAHPGEGNRSTGHGTAAAIGADGRTPAVAAFDGDFTVKEALRTPTFWLLSLAIGLRLMAQSALMVHTVPMLVSRGMSEGVAAILLSFISFARLPTVIGAGLFADIWSRAKVSALAMVMGLAAALYLAFGPAGLMTGVIFSLFFAGAQSCNSVTWALIGQYFGRRYFATLRGGVTLIQSLMSTLGPIAAGYLFDRTGNYTVALELVAVVYLLSTALFWVLRFPDPPRRAAASTSQEAQVQTPSG